MKYCYYQIDSARNEGISCFTGECGSNGEGRLWNVDVESRDNLKAIRLSNFGRLFRDHTFYRMFFLEDTKENRQESIDQCMWDMRCRYDDLEKMSRNALDCTQRLEWVQGGQFDAVERLKGATKVRVIKDSESEDYGDATGFIGEIIGFPTYKHRGDVAVDLDGFTGGCEGGIIGREGDRSIKWIPIENLEPVEDDKCMHR